MELNPRPMTLIVQITDLHLRPRGLACYRVSDTNMLAARAFRAIAALPQKPDAVVITGDLTDGADEREYALLRQLCRQLPCPVYVMPGNHDLTAAMRSELADFPGVGDAPAGDKLHYAVTIGGLRLLMLDSSVAGKPYGRLGGEQIAWLDQTLAADHTPTLVALHHPPKVTGIAHMDVIGLADTEALAAILSRHHHVERLICGHVHRTIIARFAGTVMTLCPSTAHACVLDFSPDAPAEFVMEPPAFFVHRLDPEAGLSSHLHYVEAYPGPYPFFADKGVSWPGEK